MTKPARLRPRHDLNQAIEQNPGIQHGVIAEQEHLIAVARRTREPEPGSLPLFQESARACESCLTARSAESAAIEVSRRECRDRRHAGHTNATRRTRSSRGCRQRLLGPTGQSPVATVRKPPTQHEEHDASERHAAETVFDGYPGVFGDVAKQEGDAEEKDDHARSNEPIAAAEKSADAVDDANSADVARRGCTGGCASGESVERERAGGEAGA